MTESYVELGSLEPELKEKATFIDTAWSNDDNQKFFAAAISDFFLAAGDSDKVELDVFVKYGLFDPQVDYLYIDQFYF